MADRVTDGATEAAALWEEFRLIQGEGTGATGAEYRAAVHALKDGQSALCLSGGGVRSAAFGLGVLQGLAKRGLLSQFHYLSTVSGGGYVGGWLTAWLHRRAVAAEAADGTAASAEQAVMTALIEREADEPREAGPLRWLRRNQRFLGARAGMMSGDLWAGIALFLRNLLLNWLVFLPAVAAALLVPRLFEFAVIYWDSIADQAGSSFGWFIQAVMLAPVRMVAGEAPPVLNPPAWQGFVDLLGALFVLMAMRQATVHRTRRWRGASGRGLDDRAFRWTVLLPLIIGSWLLVLLTTTVLVHDVEPDATLLAEWCLGVPLVYAVARVSVQRRRFQLGRVAWLELLCLVPSGAVAGATIWTGMELRYQIMGRFGTVHDFIVFGVPYMLLAFVLGQIAYAGLSSTMRFGRRDQEWLGRASGHYLLAALSWMGLFGLIVYGHPLQDKLWQLLVLSGTAGTLTVAAAVSKLTKAQSAVATLRQWLGAALLMKLGLFVFLLGAAVALQTVTETAIAHWSGVALNQMGDGLVLKLHAVEHLDDIALDSTLTDGQLGDRHWYAGQWFGANAVRTSIRADAANALQIAAGSILVLLVISALASLVVDVNLFSLHGLYRNRLIRTFLGASNPGGRRRNRFDGFDPSDDVALAAIWRDRTGAVTRREGPFPVLNMALNMVGSQDPALQDRKAVSFTATPLRYGSDRVGYLPHRVEAHRQNLSLGTAMAISGAAASPNWGYHSSPLIGFVLMLLNLRLGWWMQNPKRSDMHSDQGRSWRLFLQEVLGRTSDRDPYIYLSDGGHFDNLGLYEMFRRRCSLIVAIDSSQDPDFSLEELGRSLRVSAIDQGVSVDFGSILLRKRADPAIAGVYAAVGRITYPEDKARRGRLVYIKPGLLADAPADVRAYGAADARFPHDSTMNQFFTEEQFESYRALGEHVMARICGPDTPTTLAAFADAVAAYLEEAASK